MLNELRWQVIVRFVVIGGIVHHTAGGINIASFYMINMRVPSQTKTLIANVICRGLFYVQWVKVRGERSEMIVRSIDISGIVDHHWYSLIAETYTHKI